MKWLASIVLGEREGWKEIERERERERGREGGRERGEVEKRRERDRASSFVNKFTWPIHTSILWLCISAHACVLHACTCCLYLHVKVM